VVVGDILQPTHLLFVLVVALLVLGPKRLPEVGRSLGRTMRDFRHALSGEETHETTLPATPTPVPEAAAGLAPAAEPPTEPVATPEPPTEATQPAPAEPQPTATH
jgi:sec-independent protein translocase protein TatA